MKYLILTLLFSCASMLPNKVNLEHFHLLRSGQCLSGEGSGRIEMGAERYGFDYQSLLEKESHWVLVIDIPFRGEEVLEITKKGKEYLFKGSFYQKLRIGYRDFIKKNPSFGTESLNEFLSFMAQQIFNFRKYQKIGVKQSVSYFSKWCKETPAASCLHSAKNTSYRLSPGVFRIKRDQNNQLLSWKNDQMDMEKKFFKRSEISLSKGRKTLLKAVLYPDQCQNETSRP